MKVELHILQNFAPSCLNRDDTNAPKDCEFGGYRRARISSQCIKRAIRMSPVFRDSLSGHLSIRSLRFPQQVVEELARQGVPDEHLKVIGDRLRHIAQKEQEQGSGSRSSSEVQQDAYKTPQIMFFTDEEVRNCAERIKKLLGSGVKAKDVVDTKNRKLRDGEALPRPRTADIALFGRMITSDAFLNIDAACQVAHAISTHAVSEEIDFFTAVDDLQPKAETGAGMMGVVEFNSACFYRYCLIDLKQLTDNLNGDEDVARQAVQALLQAAVQAIPTGKQNTFAAHNPPSLVFAVVRESGAPWSLANAFVDPVRPSTKSDLITSSVERLDSYWSRMVAGYGNKGIKKAFVCLLHEAELEHLNTFQVDSVDALIAGVGEAIR